MNNKIDATEEEIVWLKKLRNFHSDNRTPNHRDRTSDVINMAIEGLDYINELPLVEPNKKES